MPLDDDFVMQPLEPPAAVILLGELWQERRCVRRDDFSREYVRVFLVKTLDLHYAGRVASLCRGLPEIQDGYSVFGDEADSEAKLVTVEARPHDNHPYLWAVTCNYVSKPQNHPDYQHNDPLQRRARRKSSFVREKDYKTADLQGNAIMNSAGEPYDPTETDGYVQVIEYQKNLASTFEDLQEQFLGATNTDRAFGKDAYTLKVDAFNQAEEQYENGVRFWPSTLVLHCRSIPEGQARAWQYEPLDRGTRQLIGGVTIKRLRDANGRPMGVGLLNGSGGQLAFGDDPVYLIFYIRPELSFAPLVNLFLP